MAISVDCFGAHRTRCMNSCIMTSSSQYIGGFEFLCILQFHGDTSGTADDTCGILLGRLVV